MKIQTSEQFHNAFQVIENNADGNCLFESLEYLLQNVMSVSNTASEIREMVGNFYRNFDKDINYPESTIEYIIKIGNIFDNMDDDMQHDYNIWNDKSWASMTDVLICSLMFEININLYKYNKESNTYHLEEIKSQYNFTETINILYNGTNHFEALVKL